MKKGDKTCEYCGENTAVVKWQWPDDSFKNSRELHLCMDCGQKRWEWLQTNATGTRMYLDVILT